MTSQQTGQQRKSYKWIAALLAVIGTTLASVAHGRNWATKGLLILGQAIFLCFTSMLTWFSWWGLLTVPVSTLKFWFLERTGKNAGAELDVLHTPTKANLKRARNSYWLGLGISAGLSIVGLVTAQVEWYYYPLPLLLLPLAFVSPLVLEQVHYGTDLGKKLALLEMGEDVNHPNPDKLIRLGMAKGTFSGGYNRMATEAAVTLFCTSLSTAVVEICLTMGVANVIGQ